MPSLQRSMDAEAPGHQKVQPGAVEEQSEKKLEQSEDQLEEHAQDAAAHGEVEKVKETGGGGQAPAAVEEQLEQLEEQLKKHAHSLKFQKSSLVNRSNAQDAAALEEKVKETGGGGQAPVAVHEGQVGSSTIAECTHQLHVILQLYRASGQNYGSVMLVLAFVNIAFI